MKKNTLVRTTPLDWFGDPEGGDIEYLIRFTYEHKVGVEFVDMDLNSPCPDYTIRLHGDASSVLSALLVEWNNGKSIEERRRWALGVMQDGTDEVSYEVSHVG